MLRSVVILAALLLVASPVKAEPYNKCMAKAGFAGLYNLSEVPLDVEREASKKCLQGEREAARSRNRWWGLVATAGLLYGAPFVGQSAYLTYFIGASSLFSVTQDD